MLNKCDPSSLTQRWNTSAGDPSVMTTVQSEATGNCWEINVTSQAIRQLLNQNRGYIFYRCLRFIQSSSGFMATFGETA